MTGGAQDSGVENAIAKALAAADGLNFDEVCGYETDAQECDSSTCVAAHYEDHDPDWAREAYLRHARAAIEAMPRAAPAPAVWQGMDSCPCGEYVLFRFDGPFHDSECPGVSVGKRGEDGGYWLTAIWAASTPHSVPVAWTAIPTAPAEGGV